MVWIKQISIVYFNKIITRINHFIINSILRRVFIMCEIYSLDQLNQMWSELGSVLVNNDDEILEAFYSWEPFTPKMDIWHWFDEKLPNGLRDVIEANKPITNNFKCGCCGLDFDTNDGESEHQVNDILDQTFCSFGCSIEYTTQHPELVKQWLGDDTEEDLRIPLYNEGLNIEQTDKIVKYIFNQ